MIKNAEIWYNLRVITQQIDTATLQNLFYCHFQENNSGEVPVLCIIMWIPFLWLFKNLAVQYWLLTVFAPWKKINAPNKLVTKCKGSNVKEVKVINSNKCKIIFNISVPP